MINQQYSIILNDKIIQMGNIEIRQDSQNKKRPHIFTQRISKTPTKSFVKKSLSPLSQKYQQYSPIKFFHKGNLNSNIQRPLTQRKNHNEIINSSRISNHKTQKNNNIENDLTNDFNQTKRGINYHNKLTNKPNNLNGHDPIFSKVYVKKGSIVSNTSRHKKQVKDLEENQANDNKQQKCAQIIKKVRNFNDFLNQIKKKLKQQSHLMSKHQTQNNYKQNNSQDQNLHAQKYQNPKDQKRIEISLKLQNEKLQLQKYRNLVQRQLSKNHSIQNITLSTKKSGQKILTIQYQSLNSSKNSSKKNIGIIQNYQTQINPRSSSNRQYKVNDQMNIKSFDLDKKQNPKRLSIEKQQQIQKPKEKEKNSSQRQKQTLLTLKRRFNQTMSKMNELGNAIQLLQQQQNIVSTQNNPNIQTISCLLNKMDVLQQQCLQSDRWIKQYMDLKGLSNCKNTVKTKNVSKTHNKFNESSIKYQLTSEEEDAQSDE